MSRFDYGKYFGEIEPLADALRENDERVWNSTVGKNPEPHEYVLWLGCNVLRTVNLAETIVAILEAVGVNFAALGGPANCCGIIHNMNGDQDTSQKLMGHTLGNLAASQPKAVLVYCPSCHFRLDSEGPAHTNFGTPYIHVTEFLAANLPRLNLKHPVEMCVVLHTHSQAEQQRKDAEATKTLLDAIPGLEVTEIRGEEEWGRHCAPALLASMGEARFKSLVRGKARDAKGRGMDAIATVYHSCYLEWCGLAGEEGVDVIHYTELVARAMGLPLFENRYRALKLQSDPAAAFDALSPVAAARKVNLKRLKSSIETHFSKTKN